MLIFKTESRFFSLKTDVYAQLGLAADNDKPQSAC